jgi:hypothetical protein
MEDPRFSQGTLDDMFGDIDKDKEPSPKLADELEDDEDLFGPDFVPPLIKPTALPRRKSRSSGSGLFMNSRKPSNAPISRIVAPMGVVDPSKATSINLVDPQEAMMAEAVDRFGKKSRQ